MTRAVDPPLVESGIGDGRPALGGLERRPSTRARPVSSDAAEPFPCPYGCQKSRYRQWTSPRSGLGRESLISHTSPKTTPAPPMKTGSAITSENHGGPGTNVGLVSVCARTIRTPSGDTQWDQRVQSPDDRSAGYRARHRRRGRDLCRVRRRVPDCVRGLGLIRDVQTPRPPISASTGCDIAAP